MKKTSEQILRIAIEIEAVLEQHDLAITNPGTTARLRFLAGLMKGIDSYAGSKATQIADRAETFYSTRKHEKYRGGANQLYTDMKIDLLRRIRSQADTRATAGD